jgi:hypothetical protein
MDHSPRLLSRIHEPLRVFRITGGDIGVAAVLGVVEVGAAAGVAAADDTDAGFSSLALVMTESFIEG